MRIDAETAPAPMAARQAARERHIMAARCTGFDLRKDVVRDGTCPEITSPKIFATRPRGSSDAVGRRAALRPAPSLPASNGGGLHPGCSHAANPTTAAMLRSRNDATLLAPGTGSAP